MISYTRMHILSTVSSVSCCVAAYVATEPKTVFSDDSFTPKFMCSMQAKLPIFGSYSKGKCQRMRSCGGPRIRSFEKSLQKGPHQTVAVNFVEWTSVDVQTSIFTEVFGVLRVSVDAGGSAWKWINGGPCRDRTYDQLIKSQLLYQLS
jgi:hypothetical protein